MSVDTMSSQPAHTGLGGGRPEPEPQGEGGKGSGQLALDTGGHSEGSAGQGAAGGNADLPVVPPALTVTVFGKPAPQGSKNAFYNRKTGRVNQVESSKALGPWRDLVHQGVRNEIDARPGFTVLDGPLVARVIFTMPKPTTAPKTRRTYPDRIPDLDKLARAVCDALTQAGAIADDARIVEFLRLAKVFPNEDVDALPTPGVRIEVRQILTRH